MSGLFNTLNTSNTGLMAQQTGLHTTGHNISNVKTKGFSRQRIELKAAKAFDYPGVGQLGTGVRMDSIIRVTNEYIARQIRQEGGNLTKFEAKSEAIEQLEIIFNEPSSTGLNFNLGEFFTSWSELSKNPELVTSKTVVVEKSQTLAESINHMQDQMLNLKAESLELIDQNILDFNTNIDKLESLNKQIFNISIKGQHPNDLLDQRDLLLRDLSETSNFEVEFDKFNRASVKIGDTEVLGYEKARGKLSFEDVEGKGKKEVAFREADEDGNLKDPLKIEDKIITGKIRGNIDGEEVIDGAMEKLDNFSLTLKEAVNKTHTSGVEPGLARDFFIYELDPETGINRLSVNPDLVKDNSLVVAGEQPVQGTGLEGDGARALRMSQLKNTKLDFNDPKNIKLKDNAIVGNPDGSTIETAFGSMVTSVGIIKEHSDHMIANQKVLVNQLDMRRESVSGVSINEEVSNIIKFQKSFEANAKVIAVVSEMLDTLINRTGL